MADQVKTFKVVLEPVEDGFWMASVPHVQGCRTQAKSLVLAKRRIRDALALFVDGAEKASLAFEVKLPGEAQRTLEQYRTKTEEARELMELAKAAAQAPQPGAQAPQPGAQAPQAGGQSQKSNGVK